MPQKLKLHIDFTKSPKRDSIYILHNHSSITILEYLFHKWKMNIAAEFLLHRVTQSCDIEFHNISIETVLTVHGIIQA